MTFDEWFKGTFPNASKTERETARRVWNAAIEITGIVQQVEPPTIATQSALEEAIAVVSPSPPLRIATPTRPPRPPADTWSRDELEDLTKAQLIGMAESYDISVSRSWLKADIVDAILERMS